MIILWVYRLFLHYFDQDINENKETIKQIGAWIIDEELEE